MYYIYACTYHSGELAQNFYIHSIKIFNPAVDCGHPKLIIDNSLLPLLIP